MWKHEFSWSLCRRIDNSNVSFVFWGNEGRGDFQSGRDVSCVSISWQHWRTVGQSTQLQICPLVDRNKRSRANSSSSKIKRNSFPVLSHRFTSVQEHLKSKRIYCVQLWIKLIKIIYHNSSKKYSFERKKEITLAAVQSRPDPRRKSLSLLETNGSRTELFVSAPTSPWCRFSVGLFYPAVFLPLSLTDLFETTSNSQSANDSNHRIFNAMNLNLFSVLNTLQFLLFFQTPLFDFSLYLYVSHVWWFGNIFWNLKTAPARGIDTNMKFNEPNVRKLKIYDKENDEMILCWWKDFLIIFLCRNQVRVPL